MPPFSIMQLTSTTEEGKDGSLEAAGATMDAIVEVTVCVTDVGYFQAIHRLGSRRARWWK
jgi:enamine deaminase RidA (YjgF/YER057c/UK114 family)